MAMALANSGRVAFFSHHFLWDIGRHLQSKMIRMDRYVELYLDYARQLACARSLQKNDLAIVCTVGGSYPMRYPTIWNGLIAAGCPILVITQNTSSSYWNYARFVAGMRGVQPQRCGQVRGVDGGGSVDPAISASVRKRISLNKLFVSRCRDGHLLFFDKSYKFETGFLTRRPFLKLLFLTGNQPFGMLLYTEIKR